MDSSQNSAYENVQNSMCLQVTPYSFTFIVQYNMKLECEFFYLYKWQCSIQYKQLLTNTAPVILGHSETFMTLAPVRANQIAAQTAAADLKILQALINLWKTNLWEKFQFKGLKTL